jgi:hypothetical protein
MGAPVGTSPGVEPLSGGAMVSFLEFVVTGTLFFGLLGLLTWLRDLAFKK